MFNPNIYRSYDIRGLVPEEFDAEEAYHIGRAYALFTRAKKVVVARDMRTTSEEITRELLRGLTEGGVDVEFIGLATTPMFYFGVWQLGAEGGLMVTASHNPGKYNGVKLTRAEAVPIGGNSGLMEIRELVRKREWPAREEVGSVQEVKVKEEYVKMATAGGSAEGLKVAVDAGNGMAGILLKEVFAQLGGEVVPLYWEPDGNFPNHEANPLEEKNMRDLQEKVREVKADLGVAFDGDADRVGFTDEQGVTIPGDIVTALLAQEILKSQPQATILYDVRCSRVVKEVVEAAGGRAVQSKVGHSNIKAQMRETGAVFAGELSSHFYFTPWYAESGVVALKYLLKLLREAKRPLSEVVKPLRKYAKTPEINYEVKDKEAVLEKIKTRFAEGEISELDGITINYPDWWVNVRGSNTEPVLRLNLEADSETLLEEKKQEIEQLITAAP
jgi:phosphomannomutase